MLGPTYARDTLLAMLTASIAVGGDLNACKLALFEDQNPIGPNTDPATLTRATYGGYADSAAVVWQTPHNDLYGNAVLQCLPKEFKPTDATATSVVRQVALVAADGLTIKASYILDSPITFGTDDDVWLIGFPLMLAQPRIDLENIVP